MDLQGGPYIGISGETWNIRGPNGPSRWPLYWDKWRNLEYGSAKEIRGAGAGLNYDQINLNLILLCQVQNFTTSFNQETRCFAGLNYDQINLNLILLCQVFMGSSAGSQLFKFGTGSVSLVGGWPPIFKSVYLLRGSNLVARTKLELEGCLEAAKVYLLRGSNLVARTKLELEGCLEAANIFRIFLPSFLVLLPTSSGSCSSIFLTTPPQNVFCLDLSPKKEKRNGKSLKHDKESLSPAKGVLPTDPPTALGSFSSIFLTTPPQNVFCLDLSPKKEKRKDRSLKHGKESLSPAKGVLLSPKKEKRKDRSLKHGKESLSPAKGVLPTDPPISLGSFSSIFLTTPPQNVFCLDLSPKKEKRKDRSLKHCKESLSPAKGVLPTDPPISLGSFSSIFLTTPPQNVFCLDLSPKKEKRKGKSLKHDKESLSPAKGVRQTDPPTSLGSFSSIFLTTPPQNVFCLDLSPKKEKRNDKSLKHDKESLSPAKGVLPTDPPTSLGSFSSIFLTTPPQNVFCLDLSPKKEKRNDIFLTTPPQNVFCLDLSPKKEKRKDRSLKHCKESLSPAEGVLPTDPPISLGSFSSIFLTTPPQNVFCLDLSPKNFLQRCRKRKIEALNMAKNLYHQLKVCYLPIHQYL
ncbi:hypothetical protein QE152_g24607 [Popillia japonica]|uniref:Uncharacterized protein n=1 Tax=Popillia japonica TaxID=7064 RepID=A0AAW1K618_POPJA